MWDQRFAGDTYLYGTEPASILPAHPGLIPNRARTLCIAEGEGRNAVWLAQQGCAVTGFDSSAVALEKARRLAEERGVSVDLRLSGIEDWDWSRGFDLVVGIFIQFVDPDRRARLFADMRRALAPGGRLILHGYTPEHVALGTGGPRNPDYMYTESLLRDSFADLTILRLARYEATIEEGAGHSGRSALIDLIADAPV